MCPPGYGTPPGASTRGRLSGGAEVGDDDGHVEAAERPGGGRGADDADADVDWGSCVAAPAAPVGATLLSWRGA